VRLLTALAALALVAASVIPADAGGESDPFPQSGFLGGWQCKDKRAVFEGANLYGHIDGGAEAFLELGFDKLQLQRYAWDGDEVDLELYWMTDPDAALGIYLMNRGEERRDPSVSARHTADRYQVQLLKGRAYLKVNNQSVSPAAGRSLVRFARYVEERIPPAEPTPILDLLPREGRIQGSEKIFRGPFTMERVCDLGRGDMFQLKGRIFAVAADFEDRGVESFSMIVVDYPDEVAAKAAFSHLASNLDRRYARIRQEDARLVFKDDASRFGEIVLSRTRIVARLRLSEKP
jgi:hypothetical protein